MFYKVTNNNNNNGDVLLVWVNIEREDAYHKIISILFPLFYESYKAFELEDVSISVDVLHHEIEFSYGSETTIFFVESYLEKDFFFIKNGKIVTEEE